MANEFVCNDLPQPLGYVSRVRWGSVIAGVVIGLVTYALLSLLGLAVGLSAVEPGRLSQGAVGGIGAGSGLWMLISMLIATFVGGWVSSWWGQAMSSADGMLHGVLTWSVMLLLMLMMLGRGVGSLMGNMVSLMGSGISAVGPGITERMVSQPVGGAMGTTAGRVIGGTTTTRTIAAVPPIENRLSELIYNANTRDTSYKALNNSPVLKRQAAEQIAMGQNDNAVRMLSRNTGINTAQARRLVDDASLGVRNVAVTTKRVGQAVGVKERAAVTTQTRDAIAERNVARQVTDTASRLAWWGFFTTLLSLVAAAIGGALGRKGHRYGGYDTTIRREPL